MSFRETFGRSSNSSQNLRYDDLASYHFLITLLVIAILPLGYSLLKTILNPFGRFPNVTPLQEKRQFRDKISRFKKEHRYSYITCGFVFKVLILGAMLYAAAYSFSAISESQDQIQGFDPYEILGVEQNAPIEKIKKAYRKLALVYHPDKNQNNPQAVAKFIMISKAYSCLTDEEAKEKCLKYGNPEGQGSFNVGIALPSFLIRKENHVAIMGVVFLLVVIVLPIYLIHYHSEMNKYDDFGMLAANQEIINYQLNQHFAIKDGLMLVACCGQFGALSTNKEQEVRLKKMLSQLTDQQRKVLTKRSYKPYINTSFLLINARMTEKDIAAQLDPALRFILKTTPLIVKSAIHMALERSREMYKRHRGIFIQGKQCIQSLVMFQQYFIQGKDYLTSESFRQLELSQEEAVKISKKRKQKRITDLATLISRPESADYLLNLLEPNRASYIKECLEYYPRVEVSQHQFEAEDDKLYAGEIFTLVITIKSNRKGSYCSAPNYPFLKNEGWYLIVTESGSGSVVFSEFFTFDSESKDFKIEYHHQQKGKFALNVDVMSDCYFGLDIERRIPYEVLPMRKREVVEVEDEPQEEDNMIQKVLKNLVPSQEQEVSDKEDNDEPKKAEKESPTKET